MKIEAPSIPLRFAGRQQVPPSPPQPPSSLAPALFDENEPEYVPVKPKVWVSKDWYSPMEPIGPIGIVFPPKNATVSRKPYRFKHEVPENHAGLKVFRGEDE